MGTTHSFTEYVKQRFDNDFWKIAEEYLYNNIDSIEINTNKIHRAGECEISDVKIEYVWVENLPEMDIKFKVALSIDFIIQEGDYHYDNYDDKTIWILAECAGNLDKHLDDFQIHNVYEYNGKELRKDALDDSLVPYISSDKLEQVAEDFLKKYYPEVLKNPLAGQNPEWVNPAILAERMGLSIKSQTIRGDSSIFGQIYFEDTTVNMYDEKSKSEIQMNIPGKTIIVDPNIYLLRNLGSINNTIVHECVHWDKHRKAFMLEHLYNESLSCISCQVVGGIETSLARKSTEFMEKQANQLAPRIQMPKVPFTIKAKEYIAKFMREANARHEIDVMEQVINQLSVDFVVSRQAAKIRMVQLGFVTAIGTFNYVDGHYVRPHSFKKDVIKINQTFTISDYDAAIQRFSNSELREKTKNGDYLYIENHYVYNAPLYVGRADDGSLTLTDYARSHMEECCLVFDMRITSKVETEYHTVCYLNRENSDITFEITYHNGFENSTQKKQIEMRQKQMEEWISIQKQMTGDPEQCIKLLMDWRNMDYTTLGAEIDIAPKTISRTVKGETTPKIETAVLICFGLNLPPMISEKMLDVLGCKLNPNKVEHQWIREALNVKFPEPVWKIKEYLLMYGVDLEK